MRPTREMAILEPERNRLRRQPTQARRSRGLAGGSLASTSTSSKAGFGDRSVADSVGAVGYRGPRPPAGDPPHHYHVQVFALDRLLELPAGSNRDEVLAAMKGHVRARGELVGP
jgi:phosphatidylethanolamine-binding protein (PEBP) family uncharacterized protein